MRKRRLWAFVGMDRLLFWTRLALDICLTKSFDRSNGYHEPDPRANCEPNVIVDNQDNLIMDDMTTDELKDFSHNTDVYNQSMQFSDDDNIDFQRDKIL